MPVDPTGVHRHLTRLLQQRSLDAALEFFDALGYHYAETTLAIPGDSITETYYTKPLRLVEHMLALHQELPSASAASKADLEQQIAAEAPRSMPWPASFTA